MSSYREELEKYLKTIEINGNHIADIGGAQSPIKGRTKTWNPDSYVIFDLEQPHEIGTKDWEILNIEQDIPQDSIYIDGFDTVFCLDVSEYWSNPQKALKNIHKLLSEDGQLTISFPTIYPVHNPMVHDCLRYTEFGIYKLMEETGFEVLDMIPRRAYHPNLLSDFYKAEGLHSAKRYSEHGTLGWICVARAK